MQDQDNTVLEKAAHFGGIQLSYRLKEGGDSCILFIHGLGCSKHTFIDAFQENHFPGEYTLLAADLLGHGDSSMPDDHVFTLEEQADLLLELVDNFQFREINIVAHSMGGAIALLLMEKVANAGHFFCLEGNMIAEDCNISSRICSVPENIFVNKLFPMAPLTFRCSGLPSDPATSPTALYRSARSLVQLCKDGNLLDMYCNKIIKKTYMYGDANKNAAIMEKLQGLDVVPIQAAGHLMMLDNPSDTYSEIKHRLLY